MTIEFYGRRFCVAIKGGGRPIETSVFVSDDEAKAERMMDKINGMQIRPYRMRLYDVREYPEFSFEQTVL